MVLTFEDEVSLVPMVTWNDAMERRTFLQTTTLCERP